MIEVTLRPEVDKWLGKLRDSQAKARLLTRIQRLRDGNPGDHRKLADRVLEMRIDYGPGYRLYGTFTGNELVVLLVGGDKTTQTADIALARVRAREEHKKAASEKQKKEKTSGR